MVMKLLILQMTAYTSIAIGASVAAWIMGLIGPAALVFGGVAAGCAFVLFFIERLRATNFLALAWQTVRIEIVCVRLDGAYA